MTFDWTEYLTFAQALLSDPTSPGPSEAALRSAASRAYYAAFHCALDSAQATGYLPSFTGNDHRDVPRYFRNRKPPNKIAKKIALGLDRARDLRRKADYEDDLNTKPSYLAEDTIKKAQRIIANLASLSNSTS